MGYVPVLCVLGGDQVELDVCGRVLSYPATRFPLCLTVATTALCLCPCRGMCPLRSTQIAEVVTPTARALPLTPSFCFLRTCRHLSTPQARCTTSC